MVGRRPDALRPVAVDKPWGREVWYSGVEARGESGVGTDAGVVPLSKYLGDHGRSRPVILLKVLQPTKGSLYLEIHETKSEVYIVDRIDGRQGCMLLGASPGKRTQLGDAAFRQALLDAARRVEVGEFGIDAVQAFMNPVPLRVGDTVTIPPRVPHSLQEGVHVIEFQNPVFERKILAASQPVVTQHGWDSEDAVAAMDLCARPDVTSAGHRAVETIARASGFSVSRFRLDGGAAFEVPAWSVGWIVRGEIEGAGSRFHGRMAFVAPTVCELRSTGDAEVLLAMET